MHFSNRIKKLIVCFVDTLFKLDLKSALVHFRNAERTHVESSRMLVIHEALGAAMRVNTHVAFTRGTRRSVAREKACWLYTRHKGAGTHRA